MAKAQNSDGENIGILIEEFDLYFLIYTEEKVRPKQHLQSFYGRIKSKTKEELLSEMIDLYLKHCDTKDCYITKIYRPMIFNFINSHAIDIPNGEQFIVDNFIKIIKFGFKNGKLEGELIDLIKKLAKKQANNKQPAQEMDSKYEQIQNKYEEIRDRLEEIKEQCNKEKCIEEFYIFINFICEAKKNNQVEREKMAGELLDEELQEVKYSPKPQQQKKKNELKNRKNTQSKSDVADLPKAPNNEEVFLDDRYVEIKWCERLLKLIESKFPNAESERFEREIKQAIFEIEDKNQINACNQETEQLYSILIDFYLLRVQHDIKDYNNQYGKVIEKTKDTFGTDYFDYRNNRFITSHLPNIASAIESINDNLEKAHLILKRVTPSVYRNHQLQGQQVEARLEMTWNDISKLFSKFLDHLKRLGEWHSNKLEYIRKNNIQSKRTEPAKADEKKALGNIKACVDSLGVFIEFYTSQNLSDDQIASACINISNLRQTLEQINEEGISTPIKYYGPHQPWCILRDPQIEIYKLSSELQRCTC